MRPAKLTALIGAMLFVSACSTLSGGDEASVTAPADAYSDVKTIEMQTKLARMQTENARLANRVLELQRENDRLRHGAENEAAASAAEIDDASLAAPVTATLREPEALKAPVFDNPDAPEMTIAEVPVESAPRLVQPTFASTDAVFENEASPATADAGDLFGVHLASYRHAEEAREGWRKLQRENPDELGLLEPRLAKVSLAEKGVFLRLIGGGFSSREKAAALCANLKTKGLYCNVAPFDGQRLSLADAG